MNLKICAYELERERNIQKNKAVLEGFNFEQPPLTGVYKQKSASKQSRKRKSSLGDSGINNKSGKTESLPKRIRISPSTNSESATTGLRRSTRLESSTKSIDYCSDNFDQLPREFVKSIPKAEGIDKQSSTDSIGNRLGKRIHDPKVFGHIPGIEVGTWWETRAQCSTDAVHAPFVAGISGDSQWGAYSVALSGGYDDDVDMGYAFTFTGSGGRDLRGTSKNPKNLRTAPQSSDQTFENHFNKSLQVSSQTKKPVRVIRGYKLDSKFAPVEGYRYDGLYTVEMAWVEPGLNPKRYKVCKFAFKRCPGQPPIPERDGPEVEEDPEGENEE